MSAVKDNEIGYAMLEILLAISLAGLFFTAAIGMFMTGNNVSAEALYEQKAIWFAQQGLEALNTITFTDLALTQTGSLTFAADQWTLGTSAPQSLDGGFTRTVKVEETERDVSCNTVASGGTVDTDSYFLESTVSWTDLKGQSKDVSVRSLRTNWEDPTGDCFASDCSQLEWDVLGSSWFGGKQLREIYITNNTGETKEIEGITIWWDNAAELQQIFFDSGKVWSSSGPGTPSGNQVSGAEIHIVSADILDGQTVEMHKTQFTQNMFGTTISVMYECDDGSSITFGPFTPTY
ncbi:MAG: hypothetical protein HQ488_03100 [Parcubacteria group bacterium]|nr:hypothetical protein [Parcubacteria group bacterium]